MRNFKLILLMLVLTVPICAAKIKTGEQLVNAMHRKYDGKWYKTLTFVQKNTEYKPDGTTHNSIWYEALSAPGKLRVDFDPLDARTGFMYVDGTQHSFKDGKLVRSQALIHSLMVLAFDVYMQPTEKTISQLKELNIDLSILREDVWQNRPVYVVGAKKDDLKSAQFWIDKKNLYFVRMLQPAGKNKDHVSETQFNKYQKVKGGGWVAPEVVFLLDGKMSFLEEYTDVQTDVALDDKLFDTQSWTMVDRNYFRISLVANLAIENSGSELQKENTPNPFEIYERNIDENNYLTPLLELQKDEFAKSKQWSGILPDLLAYLYSFTGEYKAAYVQLDRTRDSHLGSPRFKEVKASPIDEYEPQSAIGTTAALAEKNQIVMINEEHDTPMHRAFTMRLLTVLYDKGFRYFAAESLGERDPELMKRGYPTHKTGFYSNDPVFGEMLREALRLGFKVVTYEYSSEKLIECRKQEKAEDVCQNERERGQAQNLYDNILKNDPQAKILVHVGRGHNQQVKNENWAQMGWHFKDITGITPLSVNQMQSERSEPKYESGLYRYVATKWKLKEPTVFKSKDGRYFNTYGYNLDIFHPRAVYENGRPLWLKTYGARKAEKINLRKLKIRPGGEIFTGNEPILIQAFRLGEDADAIPVDQVIFYPNQKMLALMLPKGSFKIQAIDKTGKILGQYAKKN